MTGTLATIGINIASDLIGRLLMQIKDTSSAAHKVLFAKRSFREFSSHINKIEPILLELWQRNIHGSSNSLKVPLEDLQAQLNNASKLINTYTSGSWMYLFLKCRFLPDEMKEITQGIEQSLDALRIATLDVSLEIKEKTVALCETMRNAEFQGEVGSESLASEIEREMKEMHSDSQQVLQLIVQVANAMGVPIDQCFLQSEIEVVRKKKEDLENEKQRAEAYMLDQIQAFLCRSGIVSVPFSSPDYQSVAPLHFCCPLNKTIMENPVNLESGITYEKSAIEKWFESGNTTCPVKKCELTTRHLTPNHNMRELIQEWKEKNAKFRLENAAETLVSSRGGDDEGIEEALVEICNLCQERNPCSELIEEKNLIPRILALTSYQLESIQLKAMECLCYFARQDSSKEKIANSGGIDVAVNHLTDETEMKNLAVSLLLELSKAPQLCQSIGKTQNSIPLLISMLSGPHAETSKEVLMNLSGVNANIIEMAEMHYYDPLVNQLIQGTPFYRHKVQKGNPFGRMAQVIVAAARKWRVTVPSDPIQLHELNYKEYVANGRFPINHTPILRFLDKAATMDGSICAWKLCLVTQVEETKLMIKMLPIWIAMFILSAMIAQVNTLFVKQGTRLNRHMGPHFEIPPGCITSFVTMSMLVSVVVYDRILVGIFRRFTGNPRGITILQRMGIGLAIHVLIMVVASITEIKRIRVVKAHGLQGNPKAVAPLTIFILLPQFLLMGIADAFVEMGKLEFFYDQAPESMQSIGTALFASTLGIGNFISSFLLTVMIQL